MQVRYDAELAALRSGVERVVVELVVGPKSSAATRKAILPHMDDLAAFLGRRSAGTSEDLCASLSLDCMLSFWSLHPLDSVSWQEM